MILVEVTNYESIGYAKLEIDKFTTIVGKNFLGKSSILRAINAVLTNQQGSDFIKWGERFCEVRIKTDDVDILWHKEEGNNFYKINDKVYSKVGKDSPPDVINEAGLGLIKISDDKVNLHYAKQFFPLFLVDKRDTKTADLLISIYGLDRLYKAAELCNKDQKSNASLLKLRKKDLDLTEKELVKFEGMDEIISQKEMIEKAYKELSTIQDEIGSLGEWCVSMEETNRECKKLRPVLSVEIPDSTVITKDLDELKLASELMREFSSVLIETKKLEPIESITISDADPLQKTIKDITTLATLGEEYTRVSKEVSDLKGVDSIETGSTDLPVSDIEEIVDLNQNLEKMISFRSAAIEARNEIESINKQLEEKMEEKKEFSQCPYCGSDI